MDNLLLYIVAQGKPVNWTGVISTVCAILGGMSIIFACVGKIVTNAIKRQAEDVINPCIKSLESTMAQGFHDMSEAMSETRERVARLEGKVGITIVTPSATVVPSAEASSHPLSPLHSE